MPELPEVEHARRLIVRAAKDRTITKVYCTRDDIVFSDGTTPARMRRALKGRTVLAAHRRGKHLIIELDRPPWLLLHLGMTGIVAVRGERRQKLRSSAQQEPDDWPPRFTKLKLTIDDGGALAVTSKRRLGRIRLHNDPWNTEPISELGFDPLLRLPRAKTMAEQLAGRSAPIKAVLLDQSFASGVGNWVADEVLYHAKIDPHRKANSLDEKEIGRLRTKLRYVCRTAVDADADASRYPRTWLFHCRWDKGESTTTAKGEMARRETISGRTTAWVPAVQK